MKLQFDHYPIHHIYQITMYVLPKVLPIALPIFLFLSHADKPSQGKFSVQACFVCSKNYSNNLYSQLLCQLFPICTSIFQCAGLVIVSGDQLLSPPGYQVLAVIASQCRNERQERSGGEKQGVGKWKKKILILFLAIFPSHFLGF